MRTFTPKLIPEIAQSQPASSKSETLSSLPSSAASDPAPSPRVDFAEQAIFWSDLPSSSSSDADDELETVMEESEHCSPDRPIEIERLLLPCVPPLK